MKARLKLTGVLLGFCAACGEAAEHGDASSAPPPNAAAGGGGSTSESDADPSAGAPSDCQPAADDGACAMTQQLTLSAPFVDDHDGDGRAEPGEVIIVGAVLSNPGPLDHSWYPGVQVTSESPGFYPDSAWDGFYAMFMGDSAPVGVGFTVPEDLASGSVVSFRIDAAGLNMSQPCCGLASLEVSVVVEPKQ